MSLNWKLGIPVFILVTMFITTPFFGGIETKQFSAYAACRKVAMKTKGVAVWEHKQTIQKIFMSRIRFSDGFNSLDCHAIGIGPFWLVRKTIPTFVLCDKDLGNGNIISCTEEYYGVGP
jgi:hypothetical protein